MDDTNFSQPGQIDYAHQQEMLENLPNDPHTLTYLQGLLNNPATPFLKFLVLGKQEQVNKAIAAGNTQKTLAGGQNAAPPPTIKDKIQQESGIMALQNSQRNMMGAPQVGAIAPPASIPQAVPQSAPEPTNSVEPESVQHGAGGGIMHAPVDPRMFDFAQGGIVAFSGKDNDQEVEDKKHPKYQSLQEREDERSRAKGPLYNTPYGETALQKAELANKINEDVSMIPGQNVRAPQGGQRVTGTEFDRNLNNALMALPGASATRAATSGIRMLAPALLAMDKANQTETPVRAPVKEGSPYPPGYTRPGMENDPRLAPNPNETEIKTPVNPPADDPNAALLRSLLSAPAGGGITRLSGINAGDVTNLAKNLMPENPYEAKTEAAYKNAKPEEYNQTKEIRDLLAMNEALGVGTYGKNRREQMAELERKFEENQPSTFEKLIGLGRAFARPGARAGEVGAEGARQMQDERSARLQFAEAKNKMQDEIEKADEVIRTGNASEIKAAKAAKQKAMQDYKNAEVGMYEKLGQTRGAAQNAALQSASGLIGHKISAEAALAGHQISADASIRSAQLHYLATTATQNKPSEGERLTKRLHDIYNEAERNKPGSGDEAVKKETDFVMNANSAALGRKYDVPDKTAEHENMIQTQIAKRTGLIDSRLQTSSLKPEERTKLMDQRRAIVEDVRKEFPMKGEKISTAPNAPAATPNLDSFLTAARAVNPGVSDKELTAYYNSKYK